MICSKTLADEAYSVYSSRKEFAYDHVLRYTVVTFEKDANTRKNIKVNAQKRSLKAILLLFIEPYADGARDSEKYVFTDPSKVSVTINGSPNMIYNDGIEGKDMSEEAQHFFMKEKNKTEHMDATKFYTRDNFGLLVDMRTMSDHDMHGSGKCLVNSTNGVQLEIERKASSVDLNCHVFVISDSQWNIIDRQHEDIQKLI